MRRNITLQAARAGAIALLWFSVACIVPPQVPPTLAPTEPVLPPTATSLSGQTYTNPMHGYSVVVPPDWIVCAITDYSQVYCRPEATPTALSFPSFYVSVIPSKFTNEQGSVYNFLPQTIIGELTAWPIGESRAIGEPNADYSTFARLPDVTIGGETWAVIENLQAWEGGPDTKDWRALVKHEDKTFIIGTYYETEAALVDFQAILATFAFAQ